MSSAMQHQTTRAKRRGAKEGYKAESARIWLLYAKVYKPSSPPNPPLLFFYFYFFFVAPRARTLAQNAIPFLEDRVL